MMNRRGFIGGLAGILAAGHAPASIGSGVLMPVKKVWVPEHPLFRGGLGVYNGVELIVSPGTIWARKVDIAYRGVLHEYAKGQR